MINQILMTLQYYHLIGEVGIKNDKHFVFSAWEKMIALRIVKPSNKHNLLIIQYKIEERLVIWSDGGPKHFKVRKINLNFDDT